MYFHHQIPYVVTPK